MFWVGNQGEGTSPCCTLFFSDFRTSFSFSLWLGGWDHFTRAHWDISKDIKHVWLLICTYYIAWIFQWILSGEGEMMRPSVQGVDPPVCCTPGCYCYICKRQLVDSPSVLRPGWHMQETALWIPRGAFCPLEGGPRHIGTDTLAPVLHCIHVVLKTFLYVSHH